MYERFASLMQAARNQSALTTPFVFELEPTADESEIDRVLRIYPDAPVDLLVLIRDFGNGAQIDLKPERYFIELLSANLFILKNRESREYLPLAASFYDVATYGGCGDSVVIDVRHGPSNGAVFDFFHEAPN